MNAQVAQLGVSRISVGRAVVMAAVAILLAVALLVPSGRPVLAIHVAPIFHQGNITSCPAGHTSIAVSGTGASGSAGGVTVRLTYTGAKVIAFTVTGGVVRIAYVKGGNHYNEYNYTAAPVTGDTGLVAPLNNGGNVPTVSHSLWCVSPTASATATATATATAKATATATFTGGVQQETARPPLTLPPTDMAGGAAGRSSQSWQLLLVLLGGLAISAVILTPRTSRRR